jgi:UDP-2,3-diacylglucosamine hydrolase
MINAYFISDLHLESPEERNSELLLRFFRSLNQNARPVSHVFLLGDIFDLWIGGHSYFANKWSKLIYEIELLRTRNIPVYFFEGNHDVHIASFWKDKLGVEVFVDPVYIDLTSHLRIRIEHGDLINKKDLTYLRYRSFIRSAPLKWTAHLLPGVFWNWLGNKMSAASRKKSRVWREDHIENMRTMIQNYAMECYDKEKPKSFDWIFTGHMHVRDEFHFQRESKIIKSINLGSWTGDSKPQVFWLSDEEGRFINVE